MAECMLKSDISVFNAIQSGFAYDYNYPCQNVNVNEAFLSSKLAIYTVCNTTRSSRKNNELTNYDDNMYNECSH